ncbi:MAG: hypothetical protein JXQ99_27985 [Hyphomicrobiaceae bacterium]
MTLLYSRNLIGLALAAAVLAFSPANDANSQSRLLLNDREISKIIRHGPWPPTPGRDPSNRVSGNTQAIAFGKQLFFERRLSRNGKVACSSCHDPNLGWADGKARAGGLARLDRNTQSLFNVQGNRWFGWDGRNDSLWAHSIGPILANSEMGMTPNAVANLVRQDNALATGYRKTFGRRPHSVSSEMLLVDIAKALAAFQETIVSGRTEFDRFRDALVRRDFALAQTYSAAAQRGAALFVGRGKCNVCHVGPRFTNDEFDDAGVPYFTAPGRVDRGRHGGITKLKASRFNLLGRYNDAPGRGNAWATRQVAQSHRTFGQFKVASLRQLTWTAPFMHNGSLASLEAVVTHYSNINLDRLHSDGVRILEPLRLSEQEIGDLVTFLQTLSTRDPAR